MGKRTLYLSIAELKQLGIIKKYLRKKRKSKKKKQQQQGYNMDGIKSSGDHMKTTYSQTFGNQINRNNDISNMILLNQLKNNEEKNNKLNNNDEIKLLLDNYQNDITQNLIYGGNMINDRINTIDRKINNFNGVNNSRSSDDFNGKDENTPENNKFNSDTQFFDEETPKYNDMPPLEDIPQPEINPKTPAEEEFNYFKNNFINNYPDETKFINQLNNYKPIKGNTTRIKTRAEQINNKNLNISTIPKGKTVKIKNKKIIEESNPLYEDIY